MNTPNEMQIYDGDYLITFSEVFNIYNNKLIIKSIAGFEINIEFLQDTNKDKSPITIEGNDVTKKVTISLYNFHNTLGIGTTDRIPFIEVNDGQKFYLSIHVKALNKTTNFLQVGITIYFK